MGLFLWSIIDFDMSDIPTLDDLYDKHPEVMGERPPITICSKKISEISEKEVENGQVLECGEIPE